MLENQYQIIFPRRVFETSTVWTVFLRPVFFFISKVTISKVAPKKLRVRPLSFFLSFPIFPSLGSLFGERVIKSRGEGREWVRTCRHWFGIAIPPSCLEIADHPSARSLSVTWIHKNVINFACKKGDGSQGSAGNTQLLPRAKMLAMRFFSLACRLCYGGFGFDWENVIFLEIVTRTLSFCGYCFWSAWFALWCKNIHCGLKSSSVKRQKTPCFRRPVYKRLFRLLAVRLFS